jgi:hypothetical protein
MLPIGNLMLDATAGPVRRRFNDLCRSPADTQQALLSSILRQNAGTVYGKRHGFSAITTLRQYQQRVPLATYGDFEPYISAAMTGAPNQLTNGAPVLYTTTSGTTGASKFIPVTHQGRSRKARLMWLWLSALRRDHPAITQGKILSVVSPAVESHTADGTPTGAESGHTYRNMPPPVRWMYSAPYEVFTIDDYEAKYYALLRLAAGQDISCIATANPSTVVLLAERLGRHTEQIIRDVRDGTFSADFAIPASMRAKLRLQPDPERARHLEQAAALGNGVLLPGLAWPKLAAIGCWKGGTVTSYLTQFETYFPQRPPVRDLGYLATEVSGSVPLSDDGDSGVVAVGTNVVEFRPAYADGTPEGSDLIPLERLEVGQRYFIYVTTVSGLYRYDMNDIVEVTGRHENTPLVRFVQKGKGRRLIHRGEALRGPGHRRRRGGTRGPPRAVPVHRSARRVGRWAAAADLPDRVRRRAHRSGRHRSGRPAGRGAREPQRRVSLQAGVAAVRRARPARRALRRAGRIPPPPGGEWLPRRAVQGSPADHRRVVRRAVRLGSGSGRRRRPPRHRLTASPIGEPVCPLVR